MIFQYLVSVEVGEIINGKPVAAPAYMELHTDLHVAIRNYEAEVASRKVDGDTWTARVSRGELGNYLEHNTFSSTDTEEYIRMNLLTLTPLLEDNFAKQKITSANQLNSTYFVSDTASTRVVLYMLPVSDAS